MKSPNPVDTAWRIGLVLRWISGVFSLLIGITMVGLGVYFLFKGDPMIGAVTLLLGLPLLSVGFLQS